MDSASESVTARDQLHYLKDGISFSNPANWEVVEDSKRSSGIRHIQLESPDDGLVIILHFPYVDDDKVKQFAMEHARDRQQFLSSKPSDSNFESMTRNIHGNTYRAVTEVFTITTLGTSFAYSCSYYQLRSENTTTYFITQVTSKRLKHVQLEFDAIISSFELTTRDIP